jgi:hypothetical protein
MGTGERTWFWIKGAQRSIQRSIGHIDGSAQICANIEINARSYIGHARVRASIGDNYWPIGSTNILAKSFVQWHGAIRWKATTVLILDEEEVHRPLPDPRYKGTTNTHYAHHHSKRRLNRRIVVEKYLRRECT